jgi:hypothetical protein
MARPKIIAGAHVLVYINGKLFGRATSFTWTSSTPGRKIRVIDTQHAVELAATTIDVDWTLGCVRTVGDGGFQGVGVAATQPTDNSLGKYFTIQLVERRSGLTLFRCDMNNANAEQWSVNAKAQTIGSVSASGIIWLNEAAT